MPKKSESETKLSLSSQTEKAGAQSSAEQQEYPEYVKAAGEYFSKNPSVLSEAQSLLDKLLKKKRKGEIGWGDINPETFRQRFTKLMPEDIRKVYKKAYEKEIKKGITAPEFADFIDKLVRQVQSYITEKNPIVPKERDNPVEFEQPKEEKQPENPQPVEAETKAFVPNAEASLTPRTEILPMRQQKHRNDVSKNGELGEFFEAGSAEKQLKEKFFITQPYEETDDHRLMFFDLPMPGKPGEKQTTKRFVVKLPFGADIGRPEDLQKIALAMVRRLKYKSEPFKIDFMKITADGKLDAAGFERQWEKRQSPEEKERIEKRREFIENCKQEFEDNPEQFVLENKLAAYADRIPGEEAVRYLADEFLIGEARIKYYRQFQELKTKENKELEEFIGLPEVHSKKLTGQQESILKNLSREQLLLSALVQLLDRCKAESDAKKAKKNGEKDAAPAMPAAKDAAPVFESVLEPGEDTKELGRAGLDSAFQSFLNNTNKAEQLVSSLDNEVLDMGGIDSIKNIDIAIGIYQDFKKVYDEELSVLESKKTESGLTEAEISEVENKFRTQTSRLQNIRNTVEGTIRSLEEMKKQMAEAAAAREENAGLSERTAVPDRHLEEARKAYVAAKKRVEDRNSVVGYFKGFLSKDTKEKLEDEYHKAKAVYERARSEYIAADAERWEGMLDKFLEEKTALVEEQVRQVSKNELGKLYDKWKNLSNYNLAKVFKVENRVGKLILGAVNLRTATSLALLGGGVYLGAGTAVGAGVFAARRVLSGLSSAGGTYELLNMARGGVQRMALAKDVENISDTSELEDRLAKLEARVIMDGKKLEVLQTDELYQKLKTRLEAGYRTEMSSLEKGDRLSQLGSYLELKSNEVDEKLEEKIKGEKSYRRGAAVAAAGVGALVGSGTAAKWMGKAWHGVADKYFGHHEAAAPANLAQAAEAPKPFAPQRIELPKGAWAQTTADGGLEVHAGQRGIEGALLDLQKTNKPQFDKMISWLQENKTIGVDSHGNKISNAGALVHRYVESFSNSHGYTIGGGGEHDLNRMFAAGMKVGNDGSVNFDTEHFQFMKPLSVEAGHGAIPSGHPDGSLLNEVYGGKIQEVPYDVSAYDQGELQNHAAPTGGTAKVLDNVINMEKEGTWRHFSDNNSVDNASAGGHTSGAVDHPSGEVQPVESAGHSQQAASVKESLGALANERRAATISQALQMKDLTQSLKLVYADEYSHLFKLGHFKPSDLKKIQGLGLQEILTKSAGDSKFAEKFKFIRALITSERESANVDLGISLKKFLVNYSPDIKEALEGLK